MYKHLLDIYVWPGVLLWFILVMQMTAHIVKSEMLDK